MAGTKTAATLELGIETAKAGNNVLARLHLNQAVEANADDPRVWLWLAWVADSPGSAVQNLEMVLSKAPNCAIAKAGLEFCRGMAEFDIDAPLEVDDADLHNDESDDESGSLADAVRSGVHLFDESGESRIHGKENRPDSSVLSEDDTVVEGKKPDTDVLSAGDTSVIAGDAKNKDDEESSRAAIIKASEVAEAAEAVAKKELQGEIRTEEETIAAIEAVVGAGEKNIDDDRSADKEENRPSWAGEDSAIVNESKTDATHQTHVDNAAEELALAAFAAEQSEADGGDAGNAQGNQSGAVAEEKSATDPETGNEFWRSSLPSHRDDESSAGEVEGRVPETPATESAPASDVPQQGTLPTPTAESQETQWQTPPAQAPAEPQQQNGQWVTPADQQQQQSIDRQPDDVNSIPVYPKAQAPRWHGPGVAQDQTVQQAPATPNAAAGNDEVDQWGRRRTDWQRFGNEYGQNQGAPPLTQQTEQAQRQSWPGEAPPAHPQYQAPAAPTQAVPAQPAQQHAPQQQVAQPQQPAQQPAVAAPVQPAAPAAPAAPAVPQRGRTILVVDDSPTVRKLVSMTLEKNGFAVAQAFDGIAAIKEIANTNPDLILMDINMPRLDGYQLCKLVKKHESTRHIPVVMLSGKDGMFDKLRGRLVGCTAYLTKPFDPGVLIEAVEHHLKKVGK